MAVFWYVSTLLGILFGLLLLAYSLYMRWFGSNDDKRTRRALAAYAARATDAQKQLWAEISQVSAWVELYREMVVQYGVDSIVAKTYRFAVDDPCWRNAFGDKFEQAFEAFTAQADLIDGVCRGMQSRRTV